MNRPFARPTSDTRGFTMIEVVMVAGIIAILAATTVLVTPVALQGASADGSLQAVIKELREARELAISERRNIAIVFTAPRQIQVIRSDVVGGVEVGTTVLKTVTLEGRLEFGLAAGLPDTPDGFGNGVAIDFAEADSFRFTSEGTFVDQTGDPLNGTIFLVPENGERLMARAVTVFGPTALVRGYRWNGATWTN